MNAAEIINSMEMTLSQAEVIDLSYPMEEGMPGWPTHIQYHTSVRETYDAGGESYYRDIVMDEHTGTHVDSPAHFIKDGDTIDRIPPRALMGRGVLIHAEEIDARGSLTLERILEFEKENGAIRAGDIVMIRFGWDRRYSVGTGDAREFMKDWPGLSGEAGQYLADKQVAAVGCDTLSLDVFGVTRYVCHEILLGQGIPIIENITNLDRLPAFSYVIGLPLPLKDGSASPARLIALIGEKMLKI